MKTHIFQLILQIIYKVIAKKQTSPNHSQAWFLSKNSKEK